MRALVATSGLGLVAASMAMVAGPAQAAPVSITLLNINDFHGRIDANTTKFATTIETIRKDKGDANTVLLSAGDNIGASLFASANQEDTPTLDVLNALGVKASAVGNHEFDRGSADLLGRVQDEADFPYLGANVYQKGTTTPVLPEYDTFQVGGVTVGVIGAITQETPALVSASGISTLDFGDPVAAVNRVAAQLSDGDTANGEADVLVAEYHEGAGAGTPDGASYEEEAAAPGAFREIVTQTSPDVDVIFTGHTHKQYSWDSPVPGVDGKTRPVLQTGSYGEFIGEVDLTVDGGDVTAYTAKNVARATTADTTFPRVAAVKQITDAAITAANAVGDKAVGTVTADVTTAFSGGSYGENGYTGGSRDDRASESTMGHLVADALWQTSIAAMGTRRADLGIVNPGGLRSELLYQGDLGTSPENEDGVVTFEEANAVLPFVNNIYYVDLTGAQLKQVLEQQWQTNPDGTIPSRPFLQLGVSKNVHVTLDPTRAMGDRVTSVRIDGQPLDPAATYTVSTFSFLAQGGDNFRAFKDGHSTDTGAIDRDLWIDGFLADGAAKSPDFDRRQVYTGAPASVTGGQDVAFGMQKLDLTSLGSPKNTSVTAYLRKPRGATEELGTFPVTDGVADVAFTMPKLVPSGSLLRLVTDGGTTVDIAAKPGPRVPTRLTAQRSPEHVVVGQTRVQLAVGVMADGAPATGTVLVRAGGERHEVRLHDGQAVLRLPAFTRTGKKVVTVSYDGGDLYQPTSLTRLVWVHRS